MKLFATRDRRVVAELSPGVYAQLNRSGRTLLAEPPDGMEELRQPFEGEHAAIVRWAWQSVPSIYELTYYGSSPDDLLRMHQLLGDFRAGKPRP